jgi:hypothetical protein
MELLPRLIAQLGWAGAFLSFILTGSRVQHLSIFLKSPTLKIVLFGAVCEKDYFGKFTPHDSAPGHWRRTKP